MPIIYKSDQQMTSKGFLCVITTLTKKKATVEKKTLLRKSQNLR